MPIDVNLSNVIKLGNNWLLKIQELASIYHFDWFHIIDFTLIRCKPIFIWIVINANFII